MEDIRQEIAINIYKSGWLEKECNKICPKDKELADDLFQEIMLIILEYKPQAALETAYQNKQHLPFIKRIIMNQYNSTTSPFFKKYRKNIALQLDELTNLNIIEEE